MYQEGNYDEIIEVMDLNRPELAVYAELSERQLATIYEPKEGLFITESPKVIGRALDGGYEPVSFLAERDSLQRLRRFWIGWRMSQSMLHRMRY